MTKDIREQIDHTKDHVNIDRYCFIFEIFDNKKQKVVCQYGYNTKSLDYIIPDLKDIINQLESKP